MGSKKKLFLFSLMLALFSGITITQAQDLNINGDTIYVNAEAEVMVRFPTMPTYFNTTPSNAPYNFKTAGTGFTIIAKAERTKPAPLVVNEGGRTHKFLIVFKKNIDYNNDAEMDYDYSTKKKLEQHILEKESVNNNTIVDNNKTEKKSKKGNKDREEDYPLAGYYALLEQGDKDMKDRNYASAKNNFEKAQKLRPTDQIPKIRLDEIKAKQEEEEKLEKAYKDYITTGDKAFKKNNLSDARVAYEQALIVKKDDSKANDRLKIISEKEKQQSAADKQESDYNSTVNDADKLFNAGDYVDAKTAYEKALTLKKEKWPQEQLKKITKLQAELVAKQKSDEEKQIKENAVNAEKIKKEKTYSDAVNAGDKYFAAKDYSNATTAYKKALSIDNKQWPNDQLKKISKLIKQAEEDKKAMAKAETEKQAKERKQQEEKEKQAREKEYKATIQDADKLFKKKDYNSAKEIYLKATLLTDKSYPQEQVAAIDKITDEIAAKANVEKLKQAKEAELNDKYNSIVKNADAEFSKSNYIKARKLYNDASQIKPQEKLPKEKINDIQTKLDEIAAAEKAKKEQKAKEVAQQQQYVLAMSKGKSYFLTSEFEKAKESYAQAAVLKPNEDEPRKQIKIIDAKLDELAKENAVNAKYEKAITTADSLLILKSYTAALASYNTALNIKPDEYYPHTQINYVNAEIRNQKKDNQANAALEAYNKELEMDQKYRDALKKGKQAISDKNYKEAKSIYSEILTYKPDDEYAQHMVKVADYQMLRENMAKNKPSEEVAKNNKEQPTVNEPKEQKSTNNKNTNVKPVKTAASPYTAAELKEKYPGIDFTNLPPEQPFNEGATNSLENANIFTEVLTEDPRLNISNSEDKVKLTCQGINFEGTNVYLKFLIENKSKADFLTGAMMLTWTKRSGNKIKLYPVYLYPAFLPIITPGNQAQVIYVCKSYYINDSEKLNFELTDRLNKTKIDITISGKKYNEEETRY